MYTRSTILKYQIYGLKKNNKHCLSQRVCINLYTYFSVFFRTPDDDTYDLPQSPLHQAGVLFGDQGVAEDRHCRDRSAGGCGSDQPPAKQRPPCLVRLGGSEEYPRAVTAPPTTSQSSLYVVDTFGTLFQVSQDFMRLQPTQILMMVLKKIL